MDLNEAKTRALLINPQLERAGWNLSDHTQVQFEVPVKGYDPTPWNGFTDFSLYHPDGTVLAVVEAKRTARNAREGEEQLRQYVTEIAVKQDVPPFGFMTNGLHHYFWEDQAGLGAVTREQFRSVLGNFGELALKSFGDPGVQRPSRLAQ
jgi:type I site-specific restriction endonuclease